MGLAEKIGEMEVRHPAITGLMLAGLIGYTGWIVFQIGRKLEFCRVAQQVADRAASEAMGG